MPILKFTLKGILSMFFVKHTREKILLIRVLKSTEKKIYQSVFVNALEIDLTPDAYSFSTILTLLISLCNKL